jgi:hypothetical protein
LLVDLRPLSSLLAANVSLAGRPIACPTKRSDAFSERQACAIKGWVDDAIWARMVTAYYVGRRDDFLRLQSYARKLPQRRL